MQLFRLSIDKSQITSYYSWLFVMTEGARQTERSPFFCLSELSHVGSGSADDCAMSWLETERNKAHLSVCQQTLHSSHPAGQDTLHYAQASGLYLASLSHACIQSCGWEARSYILLPSCSSPPQGIICHKWMCGSPKKKKKRFKHLTQLLVENNPIAGFVHILPSAGFYLTQHFLECR